MSVKAPCAVFGYSLLHVVKNFDGCLFLPSSLLTSSSLSSSGIMTLLQFGAIVRVCVCVFLHSESFLKYHVCRCFEENKKTLILTDTLKISADVENAQIRLKVFLQN